MALSDTIISLGTAIIGLVDSKVSKKQDILTQDINTLSDGNIVLSESTSFYKRTVSALTSFTFSTSNITLSSDKAYTFELCVVMSSAYTLIFPSTVSWQDGVTPGMTSAGTYFFAFRTIDGGSTWKGSLQGVWSSPSYNGSQD